MYLLSIYNIIQPLFNINYTYLLTDWHRREAWAHRLLIGVFVNSYAIVKNRDKANTWIQVRVRHHNIRNVGDGLLWLLVFKQMILTWWSDKMVNEAWHKATAFRTFERTIKLLFVIIVFSLQRVSYIFGEKHYCVMPSRTKAAISIRTL